MLIKRQHPTWRLSRRHALKGLGALVALPFLDVMAPAARAQTAQQAAPQASPRFVGFFVPNGLHPTAFFPTDFGENVALSPILAPLNTVRDSVLVMSGLKNDAAENQGEGGGDHARGTATFLTGVHPNKSTGENAVSFDQLVADRYEGQTRLRSLELGAEKGREAGECDTGYPCSFTQCISWRGPRTPLSKELDPRRVFDRLFAGVDVNATQKQIRERRENERSVLDFVLADYQTLRTKVSTQDQQRLDEYLTGVRELERRAETLGELPNCPLPERPSGISPDPTDYMKQLLDLIVIAFQCDLTRSATFMVGNAVSGRPMGFLGHPASHHEYSHHQMNDEKLAAITAINLWEVSLLSHLALRLRTIQEPSGLSLLDSTVIVFGSELSDGDRHNHDECPLLVVGKGQGLTAGLKTNQHLALQRDTSTSNVFLTLQQLYGIDQPSFGDLGTERIGDMLA